MRCQIKDCKHDQLINVTNAEYLIIVSEDFCRTADATSWVQVERAGGVRGVRARNSLVLASLDAFLFYHLFIVLQ